MKKFYFSFIIVLIASILPISAKRSRTEPQKTDRQYWVELAWQIAEPVLRPMSEGKLKESMEVAVGPTWDGRNKDVTYMECFGRLMAGLTPWLALPDDDGEESAKREQLRNWALQAYAHAVDPGSPDYLTWGGLHQPLVDAAYIANSFLRAPQAFWEPLDEVTKQRYITEFKKLRSITPWYSNWLLFSSMVECFLMSIGEDYDAYRITMGLRKVEEWYVGDGFYSDGPHFAFDYYNSFVLHPMYVEIVQQQNRSNKAPRYRDDKVEEGVRRMQRYGAILERLISPEGTFPAVGRSMTYRMGSFQALSLLALQENLPEGLTEGQVRSALTCVMQRMFANPANFDQKGYLQIGFVGHQPGMSDYYTNNGSLYITSLVFLPLGLSESHSFWSSPAEEWTQKKAWSGKPFPIDHAEK